MELTGQDGSMEIEQEYDERTKRRRILGSELRRKEFHMSCRTDEYER